MKILLLNNNPVVNKLVTLSAQKTSDEIDVVESVEAIEADSYDLLVVDDTLYSQEIMQELKDKITFTQSLFICSKNAQSVDEFTKVLRKPFLPTDLVELFASFGQTVDVVELNSESNAESEDVSEANGLEKSSLDSDLSEIDELDLDEDFDDLELDEDLEIEDLDELELDDEVNLDSDTEETSELDDLDLTDDELELPEELELDDEIDDLNSEEENILDKEDLQEVQDLLDETETEEVNSESNAESEKGSKVDELEELSLESDTDEADEELSLEEQIQEAEENLTEDDLAQEVDENMLLDLASLDTLTSNDIKLAVGEEVTEVSSNESSEVQELNLESDAESEEVPEVNELEELSLESNTGLKEELKISNNTEITPDNNGVEALKKLLEALTNEDVAASMQGMKININITLGDK